MAKTTKRTSSGFTVVELVIILLVLVLLVFVGARVFKRISDSIKDKSAATASQEKSEAPKELNRAKGVSLSPKSFGAADYSAFFGEAVKAGSSVVSWAGNWSQLEKSGSAPYTVVKLGKQYGYQPVIIVGVNDEVSGGLDAQNKQRFIAAAQNFAAATKAPYIGLGNEMNRVQAKSPSGYSEFKQWFAEAAAAIKQKSPDTKVFTTFQYEYLNGLRGGLFGGKNDESATGWQMLDDFPAADMLAFTTYPYIIYKDPSLIPADYYSRIAGHTSKLVAFTELGWPSGTEAAGYESTPAEQAGFISRFGELTKDLPFKLAIWPFLYEQDIPKPFSTIGLIDKSANPKPALAVWQELEF